MGHPHDSTIEALSQWLPGLDAKGFVLVPVTAIIKDQGAKAEGKGG
ncbi:MAG: divergent polysaccharide deacetylase family protein [Magnetospirillum sp.]|nr:divergent polysaccharide deacetylase family protein [Magnetospirillum sp.]